MKRSTMLIVAVVLTGTGAGWGDTVHFKDGSTLDGKVIRPNADTVLIQVGTAKFTFPSCEVDSVEANDNKGESAKVGRLVAKRRADWLQERTGLDRRQRDMVRDAIDPLWSPDEGLRNAARRKLVAMAQEMTVFRFIESALPYTKGEIVPELMQVLVDIDPKRAEKTVNQRTQDLDPRNRGKALELVASYGKPEGLETVARGMVDLDNRVRISAAKALAQTAGKRATPALVEGLASTDARLRNVCRSALEDVWSTPDVAVAFETAQEWRAYWNTKAAGIDKPVKTAGLKPLVTQEDLAEATADHDE